MATKPLPDPIWTESAETCVGCGYALRGLASPGICPECSTPFADRQLMMAGIVRRSKAMPMGRRVAWFAVITTIVLLSLFWVFLLMFSAIALVVVSVGSVGGLVWLLRTSPRERQGAERLLFTSGGVARLPLKPEPKQDRYDALFTPVAGTNDLEFKRVSPYWRQVRIGVAEANGRIHKPIFEAGVRCPDSMAAEAERAIRECLSRPSASETRGTQDPISDVDLHG